MGSSAERTVVPLDPITLVMFALIALLIFFMFRNGKKRQAAQLELQNNLRPGAEVMLQSGIFGTIDAVDEEENKVTLHSGTSTFVVHRNAVAQVVAPVDAVVEEEGSALAPDDDPAFGERFGAADATPAGAAPVADDAPIAPETEPRRDRDNDTDVDEQGNGSAPKA